MNKLFIVKWDDAWASVGAYYKEGRDYTPMLMCDVGWVVEENDDTIVLATSYDKDGDQYRNVCIIPWDMIVSMEELI